MVILEFLLAVLYVLGVILLVLLAIALAIPAGILYGVYWLLFRSWRRNKKKTRRRVRLPKGPQFNPDKIQQFVERAKQAKDDESFDKEAFKKEVKEFVEEVKDNEKSEE